MTISTTILIVEDDLFLRQAFRMMLEDAGYLVREAGSGAETIHAIQEEKPHIILLDLGLPDRSGLDIAREVKANPATESIVIIALTGSVGAAEKRACIEAGCKAYFAKPISPKELLRKLPELMQP